MLNEPPGIALLKLELMSIVLKALAPDVFLDFNQSILRRRVGGAPFGVCPLLTCAVIQFVVDGERC